jgi:hypothetical protein
LRGQAHAGERCTNQQDKSAHVSHLLVLEILRECIANGQVVDPGITNDCTLAPTMLTFASKVEALKRWPDRAKHRKAKVR